MDKQSLRIIYMGTPDFAVEPLKQLVQNNYNVIAVITNPDKPAGRGQKIQESAVKQFAQTENLKILQPEKFRNEQFLKELRDLKADLQIVVAFKMLPEIVWNMPKFGTFNLHASLLPHYRGAAPINWAIINGDKKTGVTTFQLKHEIDTGDIFFQEEIKINEEDTAGTIHDKLMCVGAGLVLKTVDAIIENKYQQIDQKDIIADTNEVKHAPKIFKPDCKINWQNNISDIHNLIRGLSPYPSAWSEIASKDGEIITLKIYKSTKELSQHKHPIGQIITDQKTYLKVAVKEGFIQIDELQQAGKKRMPVNDFLKGFQNINNYSFSTKD